MKQLQFHPMSQLHLAIHIDAKVVPPGVPDRRLGFGGLPICLELKVLASTVAILKPIKNQKRKKLCTAEKICLAIQDDMTFPLHDILPHPQTKALEVPKVL